jgi:hypothetical protein
LSGEKADDFDALRAELFEEFDPQAAFECELVERLTGFSGACAVRLR